MNLVYFLLIFLPLVSGQTWMRTTTFVNGQTCAGTIYKQNYFLNDRCAYESNVKVSCAAVTVTSYTSPSCLDAGKDVTGQCILKGGMGDNYLKSNILCGAIEEVKIDPKGNDSVIESYSSASCDTSGTYPYLVQVFDESQQSCRNASGAAPTTACVPFGNYYRRYHCGSTYQFKTPLTPKPTANTTTPPVVTRDPYGNGGQGGSGVQLKLQVVGEVSKFSTSDFGNAMAALLKVDTSSVQVDNVVDNTVNGVNYVDVYFQLNDGDSIGYGYTLTLRLNDALRSNPSAISGFTVRGPATFPDGSSLSSSSGLIVAYTLVFIALYVAM